MTELEVSSSTADGVVVITPVGELDVFSAPTLERELERAEMLHPHTIRLDMQGLRFMDSAGLRLILNMDARAREEGRRLELVRGPDSIQRVFSLAGLDDRLAFVDPHSGHPGDPGGPQA